MSAITKTIQIYEGDSLSYKIPVTDAAGAAKSWTTEVVTMAIRANKSDATALLSLTSSGGSPTITLSMGYITLAKAAPALAVGVYYYDIQVVHTTSMVETIQKGVFEIMQDVT